MSGDLSGFSMFDLFKSEAESNGQALSDGLLAIEANPGDLSHTERLMRAAHSIKGAARIVDLDPVVQLAHAMEDCFVAVQNSQERLTSPRVDQLLQGVDVIQSLADLPEQQLAEWLNSQTAACATLADALRRPPPPQPQQPKPSETSAAPEPSKQEDSVPVLSSSATAEDEPVGPRTVPVSATNLNRIMRLASESMIDARRLQSMGQSLGSLRDFSRRISGLLDHLDREVQGSVACAELDELRRLNRRSEQVLQEHGTDLEQALWRSERTSTALYHEVIGSRMRPFSEGTIAFPRMIRDLSKTLGKQARFEVQGGDVAVDRDILGKLEAPLNHLLRNCVDHGLELPQDRVAAGKPENGSIVLQAHHHAGMLTVRVRDDGRGIDMQGLRDKVVHRGLAGAAMVGDLSEAELLEFLFLPGFSTARSVTEVSGRGVGLDVVRNMVQEVSGTVRVETEPGQSTTFTLRLPVTLSVIRAVLAEISGEPYAFPLSRLRRIVRVPEDSCRSVQGRQQFLLDGQSVGLVSGAEILGLPASPLAGDVISAVVIGDENQVCGLVVDRFIGEQDLVVRQLDPRLGRVPHISAAAVQESGEPLLIVDIEDLTRSLHQLLGEGRLRGMATVSPVESRARTRVLVVDDSVTVREVERQLLRAHGYDVDVAVDGQDGWHTLCSASYDLLITDVDMPRMNGIDLIRAVRSDRRFAELPVIVVSYKAREQDRLLGLEAGANAYLTKGSFHDDSFIATVNDLAGEID